MSRAQACATGLITPWRWLETGSGESCYHADFKGGKEGGGVIFRAGLGVGTIGAYAGVATPQGMREGDSKAALLRAYPDWKNVDDNLDDGPCPATARRITGSWPGRGRSAS